MFVNQVVWSSETEGETKYYADNPPLYGECHIYERQQQTHESYNADESHTWYQQPLDNLVCIVVMTVDDGSRKLQDVLQQSLVLCHSPLSALFAKVAGVVYLLVVDLYVVEVVHVDSLSH